LRGAGSAQLHNDKNGFLCGDRELATTVAIALGAEEMRRHELAEMIAYQAQKREGEGCPVLKRKIRLPAVSRAYLFWAA